MGTVTNATSYEVSCASTKTGSFKGLGYYDDTTALIDAEGQQYWYRIVAINDTVRSSNSTVKGVKATGLDWYMYIPQKATGKTICQAEAICDDDGFYFLTANISGASGTEEKKYHPVIPGTHVFQFNYNTSGASSTAATGWSEMDTTTYTISNTLPYCYLLELNVVDGSIRRVLNMFME